MILGNPTSGKCGIGDYVKLLTSKMEAHEVSCTILPLGRFSEINFATLTSNLQKADLISIQFSPYGFSPNGISGSTFLDFGKALKNKLVHVMFHEIWIGAYPMASWRERITGWRQKREILNFLSFAQPRWIHTTNSAALDRLKNEHLDPKYLYLFGNIPFSPLPQKKEAIEESILRIVFFGTLYDSFPYLKAVIKLNELSKSTKKTIQILLLGRHREQKGVMKLQKLVTTYDLNLKISGELSVTEISYQLQKSDIGISTTPFDVLGKSGATASMLEHGLPVLAYDDGDTPNESLFIFTPFEDQLFLLNDKHCIYHLENFMNRPRKPFFDGVEYTTKTMLDSIN